jgi:hypothetical protein
MQAHLTALRICQLITRTPSKRVQFFSYVEDDNKAQKDTVGIYLNVHPEPQTLLPLSTFHLHPVQEAAKD